MTIPLLGSFALAAGRLARRPHDDPPARSADTFAADPAHSSVIFRVKHMNTSYAWGRFNDIAGTFSLDEADPSKSHARIQVKTASIDTGQPNRDQHLKSPDFFNAVQYPTITFTSKSGRQGGNALRGHRRPDAPRRHQAGHVRAHPDRDRQGHEGAPRSPGSRRASPSSRATSASTRWPPRSATR